MTEPERKPLDAFKLAMELPDWIGSAATEAMLAGQDVESNCAEFIVTVDGRRVNVIRCRGIIDGQQGVWCYVQWKEDKAVCVYRRPAGWGVKATVGFGRDKWADFARAIKEITAKLESRET